MARLYLDLTRGVSGDMFAAACYSFMDAEGRRGFDHRAEMVARRLGGEISMRPIGPHEGEGFELVWNSGSAEGKISGTSAAGIVGETSERIGLSPGAKVLTAKIIGDIIAAEAKAHGLDAGDVHLHEIGRPAGLANIVFAGLCHDILGLGKREVIGSYLAIGDGSVETSHGTMSIPTPAASELLVGIRFRFGPQAGEMATPSGIAIVRNVVTGQQDKLPKPSRFAAGYGGKSFGGERGYVALFESEDCEGAM